MELQSRATAILRLTGDFVVIEKVTMVALTTSLIAPWGMADAKVRVNDDAFDAVGRGGKSAQGMLGIGYTPL